MESAELILGLFALMAVLALAAPRLHMPYPVLLVVGGGAVALVPGLPTLRLEPDLVLLLFLPPLLYAAAIRIRVEDLRSHARDISLLAVALVLVTTLAVAGVVRLLVSLSWPAALVLGAIVSPPDPVAAVAVAERVGLPRPIRLLIETEGLFNDATALVLYRVTVAAVVATVSPLEAGLSFVLALVGAVVIGLGVGWAGAHVLRVIADAPVENAITVLVPYVAYLAAEAAHGSGVLAVLIAGVYLGGRAPHVVTSRGRLQGRGLWDMIVFVLEGFAFLLIGLHVRLVLRAENGHPLSTLVSVSAVIIVVTVIARMLWVALIATGRRRSDGSSWNARTTAFVGWAGMRGLVTMATVLGLPLTTEAGRPFPERQLMVFVGFSVIVATLLVQGSTLPYLARRLGLAGEEDERAEELAARASMASAALQWLETSPSADELPPEEIDHLRHHYTSRLDDIERVTAIRRREDRRVLAVRGRLALLEAERGELERLRREEGLSQVAYNAARRALDVEEERLDRER